MHGDYVEQFRSSRASVRCPLYTVLALLKHGKTKEHGFLEEFKLKPC